MGKFRARFPASEAEPHPKADRARAERGLLLAKADGKGIAECKAVFPAVEEIGRVQAELPCPGIKRGAKTGFHIFALFQQQRRNSADV